MPRLLPRLLQKLTQQPLSKVSYTGTNTRKRKPPSLYQPVPQLPSFDAGNYTRSVLLQPDNPISNSYAYRRHKRLPPKVSLRKDAKAARGCTDAPREMTSEERQWWSSPYLRMLASPLRLCGFTSRHIPSDFLIRLGMARMPSSLASKYPGMIALLVPDGIEHSKYKTRRTTKSVHIVCWKDALRQHLELTIFKLGNRAVVNKEVIVDQIDHLLRVRVLQELELLAERMERWRGSHAPPSILRRLTRQEFKSIQETGEVPFENAIAVLVVPPVNRDVVTKERPKGYMSPLPLETEENTPRIRPDLPLSALLPSSKHVPQSPGPLAEERIPFYNGSTMFPARTQRAALHELLTRILAIERKTRQQLPTTPKARSEFSRAKEDNKASHAFVLFSSGESIVRGDSVPTAIALWRIRMFEGADWTEANDKWLLKQKYRSMDMFE